MEQQEGRKPPPIKPALHVGGGEEKEGSTMRVRWSSLHGLSLGTLRRLMRAADDRGNSKATKATGEALIEGGTSRRDDEEGGIAVQKYWRGLQMRAL